MFLSRRLFFCLRCAIVALCLGSLASPIFAGASDANDLPPASALDVSQSYHLLSTSFYRHVQNQAIFEGALSSLAEDANRLHVHLSVPQIDWNANESQVVDGLDAAITDVARATHQTPTDVAYIAISGMADALADKYTEFFTPDDFKKFRDYLDPEKISGIGVLVQPDQTSGYIQIIYVMPNTPADRAGLRQSDLILSVDGVSTKGMTLDDASKVLRGKAGSPVNLVVQRTDGATVLSPVRLAIVRQEILPPTVIYRMMPDRVGYIQLFTFGRDTPNEFDTALEKLEQQNARALVLDLRNNGGGYVDSALEITSKFIANKTLVTVEARGSETTSIEAENAPVFGLPVAVLVNQFSASASEITAAALQDDGAATLVGTKTFGKGVMQTVTPLPGGSAIKITTAHYLTPANRDINLKGIEPDLYVDENQNPHWGQPKGDAQLRAALALVEKKIALSPEKARKT